MPTNLIPFKEICELLEKLKQKEGQRQKQEEILCNKFDEFKLNISEIETKNKKTLFPILRLLVPNYDKERAAYNIKEQKLGKLLVNVLQLNEKSPEAKKLLGSKTDLAENASDIIKNNVTPRDKHLTVGEINDILDKIASTETGKNEKNVQNIFAGVVKTLPELQCKWFLRIILKDLKIGMSSNLILSCFHPDGPESYNACKILTNVCDDLSEGNNRRTIKIFSPFNPMFSARLNVTEVYQRLSVEKTYHIETKFDGERFQMHMENGKFMYFSRRGRSYTENFGSSYNDEPLTCFLEGCFSPDVESIILDGEMMGWHKEKQEFGSKAMPFDVKYLSNHTEYRPCYCVFDVLYYNGRSLVGEKEKGGLTLKERCDILDKIFTEVPGVIQRSKRKPVKKLCPWATITTYYDVDPMLICFTDGATEDILDAVNLAIDNREEGIVVKDINSYYILNNRNAGWHKVKPEYTKGSARDLDFVIVGAYRGESLRHGTIKSFLLACADSDTPGVMANNWICVGVVAMGLSYEEHRKLCAGLRQHWKESAVTPPPPNIRFNKAKPHLWIHPKDSVVLQILATELVLSEEFASEYTLRFPRIERIRDDKPIEDVMTITDYMELCPNKDAVNKLSTKRIEVDQIDTAPKARKKREKKKLQVSDDFKAPKCEGVEVVSNALQNRNIYILSDDEDCSKIDLTRIVMSHGGKVVTNLDSSVWCCIAGRILPKISSIIQNKSQDVLTTTWLRSLPLSEELCSFKPFDALCLKKQTRLKMALDYDIFGDSYTDFVDEETLKRCLHYMEECEPQIYLTNQEMLDMDKELFGDTNPFSFLRSCFIYFPVQKTLNSLKMRMYGATLCDVGNPFLTHVVIPNDTATEEIERLKKEFDVPVVSEDWLQSCFVKEILVPETEFIL